ncbi:hypothetical protein KY285_023396 [Solanum tuberosum]|nr:hypothetical protein KY285_023396 [Solanum tuberosum]
MIISELTLNSGWTGIAEKVGRFISSHKRGGNLEKHRLVDNNIPYANMLRSIKWGNEGRKNTQTVNTNKWYKVTGVEEFSGQNAVVESDNRSAVAPLHLWAQKTFKAISDFCGGGVETEEETHLRNHLKWARIKTNGDGSCVSKEVTIDDSSFQFTMQLWTEAPVRVAAGE